MPRTHAPKVEPVRQLVDIPTFAKHATVSVLTVRRWIRSGVLPAYRVLSNGPAGRGQLRCDLRDLELVLTREPVKR